MNAENQLSAARRSRSRLQQVVRVRRLKKIRMAQDHLEDRLLALKEMQSQRDWTNSNHAFRQLYYLARLARQAP